MHTKKTIVIVLIASFLFLWIGITPCIADPDMKVGVFGASILGGFQRVGGLIYNTGEDLIYEISYTFTRTGGKDDSISVSLSETLDSLSSNEAYQMSTNEAYGYGPVTITMTVTSSNAGEKTVSLKGFQLGPFTISQPWMLAWNNNECRIVYCNDICYL
jgi:hypothetical protein